MRHRHGVRQSTALNSTVSGMSTLAFARPSDTLLGLEVPADTFRVLVESVQDYAIYLLDVDGVIRSWNAGAERLKGYAPREIIGKHFSGFFSAEDRDSGKPARLLREALTAGRVEDVGWRVRKDGTQFWASVVITALRDAEQKHIGFAKVTSDLTDRGYRAFVEASHSIVWTTDAGGRPNADSPTWREFTGQTEDEWRGRLGFEPVHPDDVGALEAAWLDAQEKAAPLRNEFRLRRATGAYVWMQVNAIPLLDPDGTVREWFGVTTDISARRSAEIETERALELWKTTLQSIGDAVISTDSQGRVRFMNPVAERLTGWTVDEAADRPLQEVFAIFDADAGVAVENPVETVLRKGVVVGLAAHTMLRRRGGGELPIDDSAAPIYGPDGHIDGVVLVFRDVSEETRESLRRAFLTEAVECLLQASDHQDALAKIAQLAVPRLADWAAIEVTQAVGGRTKQVAVAHVDPSKVAYARELSRRYPPDPDATTGVPNVIRTGRAEFYPQIPKELLEAAAIDDEHRRIIRELDLRSALVVPLRGTTEVFGAITFVYAQSERRYTEQDLTFAEDLARRAGLIIERRRVQDEAEAANRMKDEFLATMSHELRTPLQAILGYAYMLKHGVASDTAKAIDAIERNAAAQARLVDDVLDVSRITSGKLRLAMDDIDIAAAISAAIDSIRLAAQARRIKLVEEVSPALGMIRGDFDRLQQIVWNVVSNAVKFTEPDGTVEIRAERTGSYVRIVIRDTGKGIPREQLGVIFERFRQLDSSTTRMHGGLGLGLAIVRYLVEAHGGSVRADSEGAGTGSTFTITLPAPTLAVATSARSTRERRIPWSGTLRGIRILVVDDEPDARDMTAEVLAEAGATVTTATSAREAFEALRNEPPHILISDIGMPIEDGYSLLRRIRALPPEYGGDVPAIALTAFARPEDLRMAHAAGFQRHIVKPVMPDALLDALKAWTKQA